MSDCERSEYRYNERHSLLTAVNEIFSYFLHVAFDFANILCTCRRKCAEHEVNEKCAAKAKLVCVCVEARITFSLHSRRSFFDLDKNRCRESAPNAVDT
jgi:hypothetical protein